MDQISSIKIVFPVFKNEGLQGNSDYHQERIRDILPISHDVLWLRINGNNSKPTYSYESIADLTL